MARAAHLSFHPPHRPGVTADRDLPAKGSANGKGRGARSNQSGRYEAEQRVEMDDGWDSDDGLPPLRTNVTDETPRKIITFNDSPYVGFDRSINPYRGCEHGCIYCFARPTHAYMGLSPGLDFESQLFAKPSASKLLEKELSNKRYQPCAIAMGTNTDPYQPIEKRYQIMRGLLPVFAKFNHPVSVLTKSQLIVRDLDLLVPLAEKGLTRTMISITTRDKNLARSMEPRAAAPKWRFEAIRKMSEAGIDVGVMTAPMIPGLNDDEMESILEEAADAGAKFCGYTIIRLPLEVSPLFQEWLEAFAPNRAKRVMNHIRHMNGGRDYDPKWSRGGEIKTEYARLISMRFRKARAKYGLDKKLALLDVSQFRVPPSVTGQFDLFD